jgi:ABC-type multidrug transport system fused ATPase/permease subunit
VKERGPWWTWLPTTWRALHYARPHWWLGLVALVLTAVSALLGILAPWPLAILVDSVLGSEPLPSSLPSWTASLGTYTLLLATVLAGLLITAATNGVKVANEYVTTRLDQWMVLDLRSDMYRHAQRLSLGFHEQKRTGTLMYQINNLATTVGAVTVSIPPVLQSVLTLGGMFYVTYRLDSTLALLSLTIVPCIYLSIGYYARRIEPRLVQVRRLEGETLSIVHETLAMLRVIIAFGREPYEYSRFRTQGEGAVQARVDVTVRQTVFSLVVNTITAIGTALVLGVGAVEVLRADLTLGELLVFMGYLAAVYGPIEQISGTIASLQEKFVGLRSALGLLDVRPEVEDPKDGLELRAPAESIVFEDVHFNYLNRQETLVGISFAVERGQRIAIVGPTGAGKTTLASLISRFYDPTQGRILLDGVDIKRIRLHSLRDQISVVLQEPLLFTATVADNIRYGRLGACDADVVAAAQAANAHDFVTALPKGYETPLGERGSKLSGGERQRIAVARAFLKDAPILILDEPTSSIDSRTEQVILDALDRLSKGRTTFTIAHRLSTVHDADLILVLSEGRIVERGVHRELVEMNGHYRRLWDAQTGGRGVRTWNGEPPAGVLASSGVALEALVSAMRFLLAAGQADLRVLAEQESTPLEVRAAAELLAGLTPEALDALRDLDDGILASLATDAVRPTQLSEVA